MIKGFCYREGDEYHVCLDESDIRALISDYTTIAEMELEDNNIMEAYKLLSDVITLMDLVKESNDETDTEAAD